MSSDKLEVKVPQKSLFATQVMDVADLRYCLQNDVTNMRHIAEELLSKVEGAQAALVEKLELVVTSLDTLDGRLKASEAKGGLLSWL